MRVIRDFGRVVPSGICADSHAYHPEWAELDAKAASLASFFDHMDNAMRHLDTISIQRLSPINHGDSLSLIPH